MNLSPFILRVLIAIGSVLLLFLLMWDGRYHGGRLFPIAVGLIGMGCLIEWIRVTQSGNRMLWWPLGCAYIGLGCAGLWAIGEEAGQSSASIILSIGTCMVVLGTNLGGDLCDRWMGGPRIMQRFLPDKTWVGIIGGGVLGALGLELAYRAMICRRIEWMPPLGVVWSPPPDYVEYIAELMHDITSCTSTRSFLFHLFERFGLLSLGFVCLLLFVIQVGRLFEAWAMRRFNPGHAGALIPGFGGLMCISFAFFIVSIFDR